MTNALLIRGGRILDPANNRDQVADLLIRDGRIAAVGERLDTGDAEVFDAAGLVVTPGLIDLHVHFRTPGFEEKDISVTVLGNELRIEGKREEKTSDNAKVFHRERFLGEFSRVLRFPVEVDDAKIEAHFKNGLLTIKLPKAAAALPRKIEVRG